MNTIKEIVLMAKNGDVECKKTIRKHYLYLIDYYYKKSDYRVPKKELVMMYDNFLDNYYNGNNQSLPLPLFLHKSFTANIHNRFNRKDIDVRETIVLACQGNIKARNDLINHFLPLVYQLAKKYDYLEYDDLVQYGSVRLIEIIDRYIELHQNDEFPTNSFNRNINTYFDKILREEVSRWFQDEYLVEDNFSEQMSDLELKNFIETYPCVKRNKEMLEEYLFDRGSYKGIAKEKGISHEFVRLTVKEIGESYQKVR